MVSFAKCCRPVPGDAIAGFMSSGKGIVIHQRTCPNITERSKEDRQLSVQWSEHVEGEFLAYMRVQVANQRGVLATLAATIANTASNIEHVKLTEKGRAHLDHRIRGHGAGSHPPCAHHEKAAQPGVVNRIWRK